MKRIGILGGTFDPIHIGHLVAAVNVRHALALDRVLLVVANEPRPKVGTRTVTAGRDRLAMVEAAVAGATGLEASLGTERGDSSCPADTVLDLERRHPGAELFLIVGADVADGIDSWKRVDEVRAMVTLVVVGRSGAAPTRLPGWRVEQVAIPALAISSTDLRARAADGRPLDYLVPADVIRYIRERRLYGGADGAAAPLATRRR